MAQHFEEEADKPRLSFIQQLRARREAQAAASSAGPSGSQTADPPADAARSGGVGRADAVARKRKADDAMDEIRDAPAKLPKLSILEQARAKLAAEQAAASASDAPKASGSGHAAGN